jgi:hypothetical protein
MRIDDVFNASDKYNRKVYRVEFKLNHFVDVMHIIDTDLLYVMDGPDGMQIYDGNGEYTTYTTLEMEQEIIDFIKQ